MLADGRVVLGWVDRFCDTPCIRVAVAPNIDGNFGPSLTLYDHTAHAAKALARRARTGQKEQAGATGGSTLEDSEQLSVWTFGLPFAECAADGDVLMAYYAPPAELALEAEGAAQQLDFMLQRLVV